MAARKKRPPLISDMAAARFRARPRLDSFRAADPPPGVIPVGANTLAMDANISLASGWAGQTLSPGGDFGHTFLGYPYLSELAQRPEYRTISETISTEMTRKWIRLRSKGDDDKTDKIAQI
jgi:hypothetical protein